MIRHKAKPHLRRRHRDRLLVTLFLALAGISLAAGVPALADETTEAAKAADILNGRVSLGFRLVDAQDNPVLVEPYDPQDSRPAVGLEFSYLGTLGTLALESGFTHEDDWGAHVHFNRSADIVAGVTVEKITRWNTRWDLAPTVIVPDDKDPDGTYRSTLSDVEATLRMRLPAWPAHVTFGARDYTRRGNDQVTMLDMSCGAPVFGCHVVAKERRLDQTTREFNLGFDAHAGWVDIAYQRHFLTFQDDEPDPVNMFGPFRGVTPAGMRAHNVLPDTRSFSDTVKLNTNMVDRVGASLYYSRGEVENEDDHITEGFVTWAGDLNYSPSRALTLLLRHRYGRQSTEEVSSAVLDARRGVAHLVLEPGSTTRALEGALTYRPARGLQVNLDLGRVWLDRDGTERSGLPAQTVTTTAALRGKYRLNPAIQFSAGLGTRSTDDPAYATDSTDLVTFDAGIDWTPAPEFACQVIYRGFRGENEDFARESDSDNLTGMILIRPADSLSFTAAYFLMTAGLEQDLIFGLDEPGYRFTTQDTPWNAISQTAMVEAAWKATPRLALAAKGVVITGEEAYDPVFPRGDDLREIAAVEFTKKVVSLEAVYNLAENLEISLRGAWVRFDDERDDGLDGEMTAVRTGISYKW
jgi:hypothetical protein